MEQISNVITLDIEKFLNNIPDISSSKIIYNDQGKIEEIHILAGNKRSAKQISRDIQSILIVKYDIKIDYKKISVAQMDLDKKDEKDFRFSIGAIGYCLVDNLVEIKVILKKGDEEIESLIKGSNSRNNIYRLVVQATLECVHNYLQQRDVFIVEDIVKVNIASKEVINIAITYISNYGEELLVGCALLKKDDYEAIVKATLDAINRKIVQLLN